jgi:hypothetical protein
MVPPNQKRARADTRGKAVGANAQPSLEYTKDADAIAATAPNGDAIDYSETLLIRGVKYWRAKPFSEVDKRAKNHSVVWRWDRGSKVIRQSDGRPFYYCKECLERGFNKGYIPQG